MAARASVGVPALVALFLLVSPSLAGGCMLHMGTILVPTPGPPPSPQGATDGVSGALVPVGSSYALSAGAPVVAHCLLETCVMTPDFNIAFYTDDEPLDARLAHHETPGDQNGVPPPTADYGYVYLRYGPDVPHGDGSLHGAEFRYMVC